MVAVALGLGLAAFGCDEKPTGPAPARFASVKKRAQPAAVAFCDKSYPPSGDGARRYVPAPLRPFGQPPPKVKGWTWLNVWATWCKPCVEEMGVLSRWREAFTREGVAVDFELLSIDEASAQPALEDWSTKNLPGAIRWLRAEEDLAPFLETLGADKNASIPIHALIDPQGQVRCLRVGAIHEQNYGAVKDLLTQTP